jgi:hypothetical protein
MMAVSVSVCPTCQVVSWSSLAPQCAQISAHIHVLASDVPISTGDMRHIYFDP